MSLAELIPLALKLSIIATVFSLGLKTPPADLSFLLHRPGQLVRSILSMNFIMPVIASVIVLGFDLRPPLGVLLVALSMAPVPPLLPKKFSKAGGHENYGASLMVMAALFAVISIPVSVELIERVIGVPLSIPPLEVVKLVLTTLLAPLAVGLLIHSLAPTLALRLAKPIATIAGVVLVLAALALIIASGRAMLSDLGQMTLVSIALFVVAGLVVGHLLGGPEPQDRTVLALATASRHPGIALGIVHIALPSTKGLLPFLLIYLLVAAILTLPYVAWRRRKNAMPELAP